ncbi:EamA family transporter RarD [Bacillus sp. HMF5848]|uniref:EamA family transporter RarD n=1 Tax=Bacillus sp. HMF5848 TaxID=2495421 RepID=UPI000F77DD7F|nr:EamA family transporter RarD [Bacillus sp. HMF5848]RSK26745.1 EamA family transporter RarD [Bacillus sp. HMF5848]
MSDYKKGVFYTALAYVVWGLLPMYWKWVETVPALEILAHRIIWSFLFVIFLLTVLIRRAGLMKQVQAVFTDRRQLISVGLASVFISLNWGTYIFAVNSHQIVEASLGYYINPLVAVMLGMIVLKERLTSAQWLSFVLAGIGVTYMTISYGQVPWIAIVLAFSFGLYGLAKKLTKLDSLLGVSFETLFVMPISLFYIFTVQANGSGSFINGGLSTTLLLIGAGVVTAMPLLWFGIGAQKIPLSMVGFLQYIAPTLQLTIGVLLYSEPFTKTDLISFSFIWIALTIFTLSKMKLLAKRQVKEKTVSM